MRDTAPLVRA